MNLIQIGFWVSVAFAALKLLGLGVFATLSWWWVASPLLISVGIVLALLVVGLVVGLIALLIAAITNQ